MQTCRLSEGSVRTKSRKFRRRCWLIQSFVLAVASNSSNRTERPEARPIERFLGSLHAPLTTTVGRWPGDRLDLHRSEQIATVGQSPNVQNGVHPGSVDCIVGRPKRGIVEVRPRCRLACRNSGGFGTVAAIVFELVGGLVWARVQRRPT
jgi:hypothetical protein